MPAQTPSASSEDHALIQQLLERVRELEQEVRVSKGAARPAESAAAAPQQGSRTVFRIPAFYSEIGKQFGRLRPYFRYEYMNVPRAEPLYRDVGLLHGPVTGLRFELSEFAAFKLEYNRTMRRELDPVNALRTQVSFTF
jgi:hypothetical protein